MNASELRIGNWIQCNKSYVNKPVRVTGLSVVDRRYDHTGIYEEFIYLNEHDLLKNTEFNDQFIHYKNGVLSFDDVSPIPLTEEWLLRFGFEKTNETNYRIAWQFDYKNEPSLYLRIVDFEYIATGDYFRGWLVPLIDGDYFMAGNNVHIKHVHTLQNLYYSLTGQELTINEGK